MSPWIVEGEPFWRFNPGLHFLGRDSQNRPTYSTAIIVAFPGSFAQSGTKFISPSRWLQRPRSDTKRSPIASTTFAPTNQTIRMNRLAGGMIDRWTYQTGSMPGARQITNTYDCYIRGLQSGLDFSRNGVICYPRTGGGIYSGKFDYFTPVHKHWREHPTDPWDEKPINNLDTPLAQLSPINKHGAWSDTVTVDDTAGTALMTGIPIELDPDGWSGGSDHGVEEDCGEGKTWPESFLPVIYHGLRFSIAMTKQTSAANIVWKWEPTFTRTNPLSAADPTPLDVTGLWSTPFLKWHLIPAASTKTYSWDLINGLQDLSTLELEPGVSYTDQGAYYEMDANDVWRDGQKYVAATIFGEGSGAIIKEASDWAVGVYQKDTIAGLSSQSPFWGWSDRTDLYDAAVSDEENKGYHYLQLKAASTDAAIPISLTATGYIVLGYRASDVATTIAAIP